MTPAAGFASLYESALRAYLNDPGEVGLQTAYELGRRAIEDEMGPLDLAQLHHDALVSLIRDLSMTRDVSEIAREAGEFLSESLATFEMAQRGYIEAQGIAELERRHAAQLRDLAQASFVINSKMNLKRRLQTITDQARQIIGAHLAITTLAGVEDLTGAANAISISEEYSIWKQYLPRAEEKEMSRRVCETNMALRLSESEIVSHDDWSTWNEGFGDRPPLEGWLGAPLISRSGSNLGLIRLSSKTDGSFTENDEAILVQLAQLSSVAIENARLYERQRRIAETLQRSLLPRRLPNIDHVAIAARYMPGAAGAQVGGDWYDVIELPGGNVGLALGDVVGRGIGAASVMGQMRTGLRAYAVEGSSPGSVLDRLDRLIDRLGIEPMTTVLYMVYQPTTRQLHYSIAGHLPPLIILPNGRSEYLQDGRSLPLGVAPNDPHPEASIKVEPGTVILLYTDGLVERRDESIEKRLDELKAVAEDGESEPGVLCDRILSAMASDAAADDIALIALKSQPSSDRTEQESFAPTGAVTGPEEVDLQ
jgi:hypothetical protein